jgi:molecular chaperone Hsp33
MDTPNPDQPPLADLIIPFQLESSGLRGRIVCLSAVINQILAPHGYPAVVNQLLGETVTLCALLSSMLKYEGIFTLQTSGDGPIPMLISDMTYEGHVRGCASFHQERLQALTAEISSSPGGLSGASLSSWLGKGYIAFTVDQGQHAERYQGIVELQGHSLVSCVQHYFAQSEQIGSGIVLAVGQGQDGTWHAQGIMLQQMPEDRNKSHLSHTEEDDWRRTMMLLQTCTEAELLDVSLSPYDILHRLFHEEGVRVYTPMPITKGCRCNRAKVEGILAMMSDDDKQEMRVNGEIRMTCEFCNQDFVF